MIRIVAKSHFEKVADAPAGRRGKPAGLPYLFGNGSWQLS